MEREEFLSRLYKVRFSEKEIQQKNRIWMILCKYFLQRYINKNDAVLDIGSGRGEFINHIDCRVKYAVDLSEESARFLSAGIKYFKANAKDLSFLSDGSIDAVFLSNFAEHMGSKEDLIWFFMEAKRILRSSGKLILLGPNIRYAYKEYWDFFDHHIPLSHKAIIECLRAVGFKIDTVIPKFLPFTSKGIIPKSSFLVRLYLKIPFAWQVLGKQMFIVARKI